MKKQVDPEEALILANFAVSTLDKFDVDNNKRVVKQILRAEKKVSRIYFRTRLIKISPNYKMVRVIQYD